MLLTCALCEAGANRGRGTLFRLKALMLVRWSVVLSVQAIIITRTSTRRSKPTDSSPNTKRSGGQPQPRGLGACSCRYSCSAAGSSSRVSITRIEDGSFVAVGAAYRARRRSRLDVLGCRLLYMYLLLRTTVLLASLASYVACQQRRLVLVGFCARPITVATRLAPGPSLYSVQYIILYVPRMRRMRIGR